MQTVSGLQLGDALGQRFSTARRVRKILTPAWRKPVEADLFYALSDDRNDRAIWHSWSADRLLFPAILVIEQTSVGLQHGVDRLRHVPPFGPRMRTSPASVL